MTDDKSKSVLKAGLALLLLAFVAGGCPSRGEDAAVSVGTAPASLPQIALRSFASGFAAPTHITHAGDGSGRIFVVERAGRIKIIKDGTVLPTPFVDITNRALPSGSEQGLLSAAFPPGYKGKGYFYVNYTSQSGGGDTVVSRFTISGPDRADPDSEKILLTVDQPFSNHNGGQLAFGPDGYLYIGMGDGGGAGDLFNNAQNTDTLLGKLLRIDVESDLSAYKIPSDNPFAGKAGFRPEIWALGLRNPWRFSFDRQTGDLYIADVGQNKLEEINYQPALSLGQPALGKGGENYGWNIMEGSRCFRVFGCKTGGLVPPVLEYGHSDGNCSVTGGMVYRGGDAALHGIYFFGDFCSGEIRGLRKTDAGFESSILLKTSLAVSTFGQDEAGEVYAADYGKGDIYVITR